MDSNATQPRPSEVFEQTYRDYLAQIGSLDLGSLAPRLGAREIPHGLEIPLFGRPHRITGKEILAPDGRRPGFDTRLVLLKYMLLCPPEIPRTGQWLPYHAFKDSGPLTAFFPNTVEKPLADHFSGRLDGLARACRKWGGETPRESLPYDLCRRFTVLPRVPLMVTFNDRDSDFPAQCTIFFRESADRFLDPECLAILGSMLSRRLISAG